MTGHSEQLNDLAAALVKAQSAMRVVEASSVACIEGNGEERTYRYANLASVWAAVRKPLARHGLSVLQTCEPSSRGELRLTTTLLHESGQWISGTESIPVPAPTAQSYGSALTYARRYGLAAILGVCVNDDDDGAAASKPAVMDRAGKRQVPIGRQTETPISSGEQKPSGSTPRETRQAESTAGEAPGESWPLLPYNRATETELRAFAKVYAEVKGLESVSSEDIRRDFGIEGKLAAHFGATPLGDIIESARSGAPQPDAARIREAVRKPDLATVTEAAGIGGERAERRT